MSVNRYKAPPGALPWIFITVDDDDRLFAFPQSHVAEVSRPSFDPSMGLPSSVVLRGREMKLVDLPRALGAPAPLHRVLRMRTDDGGETAVAVTSVIGTRWRLPETLFPPDIPDLASHESNTQKVLGLLSLVGPEHPDGVHTAPASTGAPESSR